jgi:hypothetical protein
MKIRIKDIPPARLDEYRRCSTADDGEFLEIDQTTRCYRRLFRTKSRGFGDTISKLTHALGIPECGGCAKRRGQINKIFPYSPDPPA